MTYTVNETYTVTVVHKVLGYHEDRQHYFETVSKAKAFIKKANSNDKFRDSLNFWTNDRKSTVVRVEPDIIKTTKISIFNQEVVR